MYELPSLYPSVTGFSMWCNSSSCFIGHSVPLNLDCFIFFSHKFFKYAADDMTLASLCLRCCLFM